MLLSHDTIRAAERSSAPLDVLPFAGLSARDLRILALARRKLGGATVELAEAVRALREATAELIPDGRVFLLGSTPASPVLGSFISGVGLTAAADGLAVVRMRRDSRMITLGSFSP